MPDCRSLDSISSDTFLLNGVGFTLKTLPARTILCLPGKGTLKHHRSIKPQWELLIRATENLIALLRENTFPGLPAIHPRHVVEILLPVPDQTDEWWLCCALPGGPSEDDWREAMKEEEITLSLKSFAGLNLKQMDEACVVETVCDSSQPFNPDDVARVSTSCAAAGLAIEEPLMWLADLDANTGSLGLSILRVPVRQRGNQAASS